MSADIPGWDPKGDKPPKGKAKTADAKKAPPSGFKLSFDELEENLQGAIDAAASLCMMRANWRADGVILLASSDELAASYRTMAEANPYVRKTLDSLLSGATTLGALMPTISVTLAILSNHEKNPTGYQPVPFAVYEVQAAKKMHAAQQEALAEMTPEERATYEMMMMAMAGADMRNGGSATE